MATITNKTRSAHTWREYVSAGGTNGQIDFAGGYVSLEVTVYSGKINQRTVYPALLICGTGGLVVVKDHEGNEYAFTSVAGASYVGQFAQLDTTNTTADQLSFWYNA